MKKITSLLVMILVVALLCGIPVAAAAEKDEEFATPAGKVFNDYMTKEGYEFTHDVYESSVDGKEDHFLFVSGEGYYIDEVDIDVYFTADGTSAEIFIWDYVEFSEDQIADMLVLCNEMNLDFRFGKFYIEADNTVTVQGDAIFFDNDIGEICEDFISTIFSVADDAYPSFEEALGLAPVTAPVKPSIK